MLGFGHAPEIIILLVIVLLVFGPGKLPEIGSAVGRGIREFRDATTGSDRPQPMITPAAQQQSIPQPAQQWAPQQQSQQQWTPQSQPVAQAPVVEPGSDSAQRSQPDHVSVGQ